MNKDIKKYLLIKIIIAAILILVSVYILYYAYYTKDEDSIIILYNDDNNITKIKVENKAEDNDLLNNDDVISRLLQQNIQTSSTLLPEPENPMKIDIVTENHNKIDLVIDDQLHLESLTSSDMINIIDLNSKADRLNRVITNNQSITSNKYKIQLAVAQSKKDAKSKWNKMRSQHKHILDNVHMVLRKIKHDNDDIIYQILIGEYSDINQVKSICKTLFSYQQNCIIVNH